MASGDSPPTQLSGLEKFYVDNFVFAIVISVCCTVVGLVLPLIGIITFKDPKAKNNAVICLIVSVVLHGIGIVGRFAGLFGHLGN